MRENCHCNRSAEFLMDLISGNLSNKCIRNSKVFLIINVLHFLIFTRFRYYFILTVAMVGLYLSIFAKNEIFGAYVDFNNLTTKNVIKFHDFFYKLQSDFYRVLPGSAWFTIMKLLRIILPTV